MKYKTTCFWIENGHIHFVDFKSGKGFLAGFPPITGSISTGWHTSNEISVRPGIKEFYHDIWQRLVEVPIPIQVLN